MNKRIRWLACAFLGTQWTENLLLNRMIKKCKNSELNRSIKENKEFYNTHLGERCFILGNGPSLKDVPLEKIADEFVFSCNNFALVDDYKKAKTNVHLWADLSFFELREDQKYDHDELMSNYKKIAGENPICFFHEQAFDFVQKNGLNDILDVHYFRTFSPIDSKIRNQFDLSRAISVYATVVQYAVSIAVYMGFKEIYLLGCDSTNIISAINSAMNVRSEGMHAYKNDDVNERYKELLNHWSMTELFYDQYYLFEGYQTLKIECDKRKITIINCSSKTLINEIPRSSLDCVL